ncbi:MAG TPA: SRPBCC family protein [Alphaproteobacteria bacterium]|nr:SRPBCC family protein [Alphaproteobacteria bacterium]
MSETFVYVTYIRTTPEKLWAALTKPEFTRAYWFGMRQDCDWKKGSDWKLVFSDGTVADTGTVEEIDPPRLLVLSWQNEFKPELKAEGPTRAVLALEKQGEVVKLTVTHSSPRAGAKIIGAVSNGWPLVLASLKSLLETGAALPGADRRPDMSKAP